jgi:Tol biopolymer transport system component
MSARTVLSTALVTLAVGAPAAGASPGLNGYIAFGSSRTGSAFSDDIYVTPLDVETPIQLTTQRPDDGQPSFSPDGTRIAFKTVQFGSNELATMRADGSDKTLLTHTFHWSEGQPNWSGDGRSLFYRRTPQNPLVQHGEIWSLDIEASAGHPTDPATRSVLATPGDIRYPTVSPDGTEIAFRAGDLVEANGDEEIYVMNADGSDVRQLTANADFDSAPAWSPDGKRIAFEHADAATLTPGSSTEPEQKDIFVMKADGSDVQQITASPGKDEGPVWSPDGTKIAFSSDRDGQQEIYVMNADGSEPRRLTDNPARDESADWQSLPFDTTGHDACGDVSLAAGGASSVVTELHSGRLALRLAQDWAAAADDDAQPARLHGFRCTVSDAPYDLAVVDCARAQGQDDTGFVWRRPAR